MTSVSMGTSRVLHIFFPIHSYHRHYIFQSMVLEFIFPLQSGDPQRCLVGILLNFPGSRSAMLWNMLAICPAGRLYASKRFSEIISVKGGQRPQCPPMTFRYQSFMGQMGYSVLSVRLAAGME